MEDGEWHHDRLILDDLVFRLELSKSDDWDLGDECFRFYKDRSLVDQYADFFGSMPDFRATNMIELGIWDGASLAFWYKYFVPQKLVGLDLASRDDSPYFRRFISDGGLADRIKTYWATDQADARKLREVVRTEFSADLDLVIDDASHLYGPTKASFETLFPLLRPGGLYVIEDWAWLHWPSVARPNVPNKEAPTRLILQLVEAAGSLSSMIARVVVVRGFVAIERSAVERIPVTGFRVEDEIVRRTEASRSPVSVARGTSRRIRRLLRSRTV